MNNPVEWTLTLEREELDIFRKLAGGETQMAAFLAMVIRKLHRERQILGEDADLDQVICAVQRMAEENRRYKEQAHLFQARLQWLIARQAELMATVEYLQGAPIDLHHPGELHHEVKCPLQ
jgi:hypothetical protein